MPGALLQALCLVAVIEGLFLFAAPGLWRRTMEQRPPVRPERPRKPTAPGRVTPKTRPPSASPMLMSAEM